MKEINKNSVISTETLLYLEERTHRIDCAIRNLDRQELLSCWDLYANRDNKVSAQIMSRINSDELDYCNFDKCWPGDEYIPELDDLPDIKLNTEKVELSTLRDIEDENNIPEIWEA